jgi:hypothetical protein
MHTSDVEVKGVDGGRPAPGRLTVDRSPGTGREIVPQRRSPPGEFQGVEAPPDVVKYFADDRRLGDEADDKRQNPVYLNR